MSWPNVQRGSDSLRRVFGKSEVPRDLTRIFTLHVKQERRLVLRTGRVGRVVKVEAGCIAHVCWFGV